MPKDIKAYRVFIASPGGLQDERNAFRSALTQYNEVHGFSRGVMFLPVGWEDTLGGIGRPQHIINQDLRECDFMVLLLWDRWGSPPDRERRFRSGVEEEFHVAMECLRDPALPMQQVVVLFKAVHEKQLSDPGPQLQAVLEFRKSLEESKEHLFQTFDEVRSLESLLNRHLASWVRTHERGQPPKGEPLANAQAAGTDPSVAVTPSPQSPDADLLAEAQQLVEQGKRTDAETLFARAIVRGAGPDVLIAYGDFLERDGRLAQAAELYRRAIELAELAGNHVAQARGLLALGKVLFTRGDLDGAEQTSSKSLEISQRYGQTEEEADSYQRLGGLSFTRGDMDVAEVRYRKALALNEQLGRQEGIARAHTSIGNVLLTRGDLPRAEQLYRKAMEISEREGWRKGMADAYGNLGLVLHTRGNLEGAERLLRKSLEINEGLGWLEGVADAHTNIGNLLFDRGDFQGAEQMHRKSLEISERSGRLEGIASAYGNLGNLLFVRGDRDGAEQMHRKSLEITIRLGWLEGMADTYANLGNVLNAQGSGEGSRDSWSKAAILYERIGVSHRAAQIRALLPRAPGDEPFS